VNTTVSDSRLTIIRVPGGSDRFLLGRYEDGQNVPLGLFGTEKTLYFQQTIHVIDDEHGSPGAAETGKRCRTASYRYALNGEDGKPIIRWEYDRRKPKADYEYPLAHVHVHGELSDGTDLERLHIATSRVPIEQVIRHLLSEELWGVSARSEDWEEILNTSLEGFLERRSDVVSPGP
jgi:hypothetical protein